MSRGREGSITSQDRLDIIIRDEKNMQEGPGEVVDCRLKKPLLSFRSLGICFDVIDCRNVFLLTCGVTNGWMERRTDEACRDARTKLMIKG